MQEAKRRSAGSLPLGPLIMLVFGLSCGGQPRADNTCDSGIGLAPPPCSCIRWVNYVAPGGCCCQGQGCVKLQPDLSTVPARAVVKVGDRFLVGSGNIGTPAGCNEGNWNNRPTWNSTDSSVIRFESAQPADFSVGQFVAVAPGVATVGVEDVLTPSGQTERVRLTACSQQTALGSCTSRVPLDIVVMP